MGILFIWTDALASSLSRTLYRSDEAREREGCLVGCHSDEGIRALYSKVRLLPKTYFVTPELWYNFRDHEKSFGLLERPNTRLILAALCKYKWVTVGGTFQHLLFPPSSSSSSHSFFLSPEPFFCNALRQSGAGCSILLASDRVLPGRNGASFLKWPKQSHRN